MIKRIINNKRTRENENFYMRCRRVVNTGQSTTAIVNEDTVPNNDDWSFGNHNGMCRPNLL